MEILTRWASLRFRLAPWLLLGLLTAAAGTVLGQVVDEYTIKAAILYNFTKFVEWPPASFPDGTFTIGIFGDDPFEGVIEDLTRGKAVSGHQIRIRRLQEARQARDCNMVFVTSTDSKRIQQLLDATNRLPVLTVGETTEFLDQGGIIHLWKDKNRVAIVINNSVVAAKGLKVSAQLLNLATIYQKAKGK